MLTLRRPVGDIGDYLDAIGTVTAVYTATITAQATGLVTGRFTTVKAG
jgi:hypothetical protein